MRRDTSSLGAGCREQHSGDVPQLWRPQVQDTAMLKGVPPDVPEFEGHDEFFKDLCDLMEEHSEERDIPLEHLLFNMRMFTEEWIFTLYMTGGLWDAHKEANQDE